MLYFLYVWFFPVPITLQNHKRCEHRTKICVNPLFLDAACLVLFLESDSGPPYRATVGLFMVVSVGVLALESRQGQPNFVSRFKVFSRG